MIETLFWMLSSRLHADVRLHDARRSAFITTSTPIHLLIVLYVSRHPAQYSARPDRTSVLVSPNFIPETILSASRRWSMKMLAAILDGNVDLTK